MKFELESASNFIVHLIRLNCEDIREFQLQKFRDCLLKVFQQKYQNYWLPEKPLKGSSYRTLRINDQMNPLIKQAGKMCKFTPEFLEKNLPKKFTMWIDPLEVCFRFGEFGNIYVLYEYKEGVNEPWNYIPSSSVKTKTTKPEKFCKYHCDCSIL